jgi:4-hydroxy-tetrahydrodipicolinate reductase
MTKKNAGPLGSAFFLCLGFIIFETSIIFNITFKNLYSMNIALIGYGKMGKEIERIAQSRGHNVVLTIDKNNIEELTKENIQKADVAIEFTIPSSALNNYKLCMEAGVPVVSGTTGWLERMDELKNVCKETNGGFFYASNFSVGVNLFFALNKKLASLMNPFDAYDVEMEEIHHIHKLDAPSGTAITLAEGVFENLTRKEKWELDKASDNTTMKIDAIREGEVPGTHTVKYFSDVDEISITHEAYSRKGFALGAVLAAEFMNGKNGIYGMDDLLGIK